MRPFERIIEFGRTPIHNFQTHNLPKQKKKKKIQTHRRGLASKYQQRM